jgi:hypothetical protein
MTSQFSDCENKKAREFSNNLNETVNTSGLVRLNNCVQKAINKLLSELAKKEEKNLSEDVLTYKSMDENTKNLYNYNYVYILLKLIIFFILGFSYFYLLK